MLSGFSQLNGGGLGHSAKSRWADLKTGTALGALILLNDVNLSLAAANGANWTVPETDHAAFTLLWLDVVRYQRLTYPGWAAFFLNMSFILIAKVFEGTQHRIGCSCPQSTQGRRLDGYCYLF